MYGDSLTPQYLEVGIAPVQSLVPLIHYPVQEVSPQRAFMIAVVGPASTTGAVQASW